MKAYIEERRELKEYRNSVYRYYAKSNGEIEMVNIKTGVISTKKQNVNKDGYLQVKISRKSLISHRLILNVFDPVENLTPSLTVNHKNGNKLDNRVDNLEWMSSYDNIRHAIEVLKVIPTVPCVAINVLSRNIENKFDSIVDAVTHYNDSRLRDVYLGGFCTSNTILISEKEFLEKGIKEVVDSRIFKRRSLRVGKTKYSEETVNEVANLFNSGKSITEISEKYRIDRKGIREMINGSYFNKESKESKRKRKCHSCYYSGVFRVDGVDWKNF